MASATGLTVVSKGSRRAQLVERGTREVVRRLTIDAEEAERRGIAPMTVTLKRVVGSRTIHVRKGKDGKWRDRSGLTYSL